jgi:TrmH family RNA methyltransferase
MISKSDIKFIKSLANKKCRDESSVFIAEGDKIVKEALASSYTVESVYYKDDIGEDAMSRISLLSTPSPVLAVVKMKRPTADSVADYSKLYFALDSVRDPGNMGTIIRISDWFGIDTIFASEDTVDVYNPKVVQASMGSIFRVEIRYGQLDTMLSSFKGNAPVYGTFLSAKNIYETQLSKNGVIVLGSESHGISAKIEDIVDQKILIPQYPIGSQRVESLNVAVSAAIVASEFRRFSA